jgi:hypothetical protein
MNRERELPSAGGVTAATLRTSPVMYEASSDAMKTIVLASSSEIEAPLLPTVR